MKLTVDFHNFENAPKNTKKCKLELQYNYSIIDFSSKTPSSTYPTQGSMGQIHPTYCFSKKKKQREEIKIIPHLAFIFLLLLPLSLQPAVGFGLSNNTSPFFPIYHQLCPSSHSLHLKISSHFSPSFPGSSSSSRPFQFLSEDLFVHPILLHSLQVTQPTYPLPLYPFYYIFSFIQIF